jgi:hypothetical protein
MEHPPLIAKVLGHVRRRGALIGKTPCGPPERLKDRCMVMGDLVVGFAEC